MWSTKKRRVEFCYHVLGGFHVFRSTEEKKEGGNKEGKKGRTKVGRKEGKLQLHKVPDLLFSSDLLKLFITWCECRITQI